MARKKKPTDEYQEPIKEKTAAGGADQTTPEEPGAESQEPIKEIVISTEHDQNPPDDWKKKAIERINEQTREHWQSIAEGLEVIQYFFKLSPTVSHNLAETMQAINEAIKQPGTEAIQQLTFASLNESFSKISAIFPVITQMAESLQSLKAIEFYLLEELKKPQYEGKTLQELQEEAETDENGEPVDDSLYWQAMKAAAAAKQAAEVTPAATARRTDAVDYPLDKPNSMIWNLLEEDTEGQIEFNLAKYGSRQEVLAFYSIDFDDLEGVRVTKRLQPFDKLVYIATAALFNAGNNVISLSQIYYAMGGTSTPGEPAREKIYEAVTKMATARITFDNEQEAKKYKYTRFKYEGALLPCEIGQAEINGKWTDKAIHIFREPPLITFARQRRQITTLDIKLLQAPVNKTDDNLKIQDYLLERISKARNSKKRSEKILLKTLYDRTDIKTKKQIQRAPGKIEKYLKHFQQVDIKGGKFITRYEMSSDGSSVTVYWK